MSRYLSVTLLLAGLAALVGAQGPAGPTPADQARLLTRNRDLLRATVANSLELTDKYSPLERAGTCNKLVKVWAGAVEQAARDHDAARAAELGGHLNKVADVGVAGNLRTARAKIEPGSPMEDVLFRHRDQALEQLRRLEQILKD